MVKFMVVRNRRALMKFLFTLAGVLTLALNISGQQPTSYKPNGWQGLILDRSTPEDATRTLGQPAKDKIDKLDVHNIDKWLSPKHKEKIFRKLIFKKIGEVEKAELAFLDDRLVSIRLEYAEKKFPTRDLEARLGLAFILVEKGVASNSNPSMYEGQKRGVKSADYPARYYMVSVTAQSLISAYAVTWKATAMNSDTLRVSVGDPMEGHLAHIEIVSRSLTK